MPVYGVDIHGTYQRGIDFGLLARQGYSFAAVKATQGTTDFSASYTQQFLDWVPRIKAAGLIPGAYHWVTNADPAAQMRNFWRRLREVGGPKGMLIQLDCEDNATEAVLRGCVVEWRRLSGGYPFLIYTGKWWWGPRGWNGAQYTPYLWHSHYLPADADVIPDDPAAFARRIPADWWGPGYGGWARAAMIQFTSEGDAGSLGNNVDLNVFPGTLAELRVLAGLNGGDEMANADEIARNASNADIYGWHFTQLDDDIPGLNGGTTKLPNKAARLLKQVAADVAEVKARPSGAVEVTADLMHALGDQVIANITPQLDHIVEAAVRRVLGGLDGATPPAGG